MNKPISFEHVSEYSIYILEHVYSFVDTYALSLLNTHVSGLADLDNCVFGRFAASVRVV